MTHNLKRKYQIALRRFYSQNAANALKNHRIQSVDQDVFINYINSQRLEGMTDENFGSVWGLDHIVPVDAFDLDRHDDLSLCYHILNLTPMFNNDNRTKGTCPYFAVHKLNNMKSFAQHEIIDKLIFKAEQRINDAFSKYMH